MSKIIDNLNKLFNELSTYESNLQVVIATKYASLNDIKTLNNSEHPIIFGENRVQSGAEKQSAFPNINTPWHFIGHLQRNKVKSVIKSYDLIQSVDSLRLIDEINAQSIKLNQTTNILLQANLLNDESKFGFNETELIDIMTNTKKFKNIMFQGLMTMAPHTSISKEIEKRFKKTKEVYDNIKKEHQNFKYLSMGMSNDYKIAINEGSNMIRIGSIIFK